MEAIYVVFLLLIIYLIVANKSSNSSKLAQLEAQILELQRLIKQNINTPGPTAEAPKPAADTAVKPPAKPAEVQPPKPVVPPTVVESDIKPQPFPSEIVEQQKQVITTPISDAHRPARPLPPLPPPRKPAEPQLSFFERHPDLEKFIGENLINKIGIAILVLAIGFFVKYAIDNNWVGPAGRVGIGVLCGGILIGVAHRLRKSYAAFSSVLVGGGLAVLYFTITLAYHQFHLFNQTASFIILIVITIFAVVLSLLYDRQELGVIALVGGLGSPFMVSSGQANYSALFIYMVILNAGLLVIAYNKSWRILNASAFGLTVIVFAGVVFTLTKPSYGTGLMYASILYLMFFAINIANNLKENKKFIGSDFSILLINTALYFAVGLYLLTEMHYEHYRGLFSALLAIVNLLLSYLMFKNKKVDTNILYLLIGITLTFISLTAPIQLHGHNITLFWAAEAVLLYWLYQKSTIKLMKLTAFTVWCLMVISLLMDLGVIYGQSDVTIAIIANKGFITTLVAAIGTYLLYWLVKKDEVLDLYGIKLPAEIFRFAALVFLFLSGLLEINHQFLNRYPGTALNTLYLMLYVPVFVYMFALVSKKYHFRWALNTGLIAAAIVVYTLSTPDFFDLQYSILLQHKLSSAHFAAHWIGAVFIGLLFFELTQIAQKYFTSGMQKAAGWVLAGFIVLFLSLEVSLASNLMFYSATNTIEHIRTVYIKTGLPILWGLLSFALMMLGMRHKARTLRIISLTLFSVTLLKLFLFDIQNIPPAGKIAAFFCLGILLLIISFMYQKVKKIIVEDEVKEKE
ncbi:DUF2339 domain-containing protein [Mucilaginibacter gynuensis]|uniref:DUF2339 domain-containing protein n=1 Tax=Mucilaginibacter gynuensis TaxID=1302236 RepID=A0ABP8GPI4_9SPHI